jgi:hypothetical protein
MQLIEQTNQQELIDRIIEYLNLIEKTCSYISLMEK